MVEKYRGGTWLGITKAGRISAITNIRGLNNVNGLGRKARGRLITDFLRSKEKDTYRYWKNLHTDQFRLFNLIAGDLNGELYYISNAKQKQPPLLLDKGR